MCELKKKSSALEDPEIFHDEGTGNHSQALFCYSLNKMKTLLFQITDSSIAALVTKPFIQSTGIIKSWTNIVPKCSKPVWLFFNLWNKKLDPAESSRSSSNTIVIVSVSKMTPTKNTLKLYLLLPNNLLLQWAVTWELLSQRGEQICELKNK